MIYNENSLLKFYREIYWGEGIYSPKIAKLRQDMMKEIILRDLNKGNLLSTGIGII